MSTEYFIQYQKPILLSSPWNFPLNRSYLRAQSKLQQMQENRNNPHVFFSDHNVLKLEFNNNNKNNRKFPNNCRQNNMLLNCQWVVEEIREEIESFLEIN
jgi:hypothetical protein